MTTPDHDKQARRALDRLRRVVAIVLGALAVASVAAALAGAWPAAAVDELALRWFSRASLRLRIVGCFVAYGLVVLAGVLLVLSVQRLLGRRAADDR